MRTALRLRVASFSLENSREGMRNFFDATLASYAGHPGGVHDQADGLSHAKTPMFAINRNASAGRKHTMNSKVGHAFDPLGLFSLLSSVEAPNAASHA